MASEKCCLCEKTKPRTKDYWNKEHIIPRGFGNDGVTEAVLEYSICKTCNDLLRKYVDRPFLRHVESRRIENECGMRRRHPESEERVEGSGVIVVYQTTISHLLICMKIAFETHMKFLGEEYRDSAFQRLRDILWTIMNPPQTSYPLHNETIQAAQISKLYPSILQSVVPLDKLVGNADSVVNEAKKGKEKVPYSHLLQLACLDTGARGIYVLVLLESLPPLAVRVSNEIERYISTYGRERTFLFYRENNQMLAGFADIKSD